MSTSPAQSAETPAPRSKYRTEPEPIKGYPRCIPFIVANEFAERFSFYGMQAILVVFMTQYLRNSAGQLDVMSRDDAVIWNNHFNSFVYFTPIFGALLADIFWGKYRTIFWISLLYCFGHLALALGDTRMNLLVGLTLIGMGAGGIKPCVSANVGDQFSKTNEHLLAKIYNWFYFSINLGAALAQNAIPWLRVHYGPHVAFGVPGILMAIATFVFWLGRKQYVHRPPQGWQKVKENFRGQNLKILIRLVIFFLFVAPFYALYYQSTGSWVNQARDLDLNLHIFGITLYQDSVQSINSFLILAFIPLFSYVVYPLVGKLVKLTPQRKIGAGMFVVIPAFFIASYLQKEVAAGRHPTVWWQLLGYTIVTAAEILVSIPALEFAYTQAPKKMKSMIMAAYLAGAISFGNQIAAWVIDLLKVDWIHQRLLTTNDPDVTADPNYNLVLVGLIVVAGFLYILVSWLLPKHDFVADEVPVEGAA